MHKDNLQRYVSMLVYNVYYAVSYAKVIEWIVKYALQFA